MIAQIIESTKRVLDSIPPGVTVVAAAKGRTNEEVEAAIKAGITNVGHNYIQEAQPMIQALGDKVTWHMIGHLQRNKVKKAVPIFNLIETVDSSRLAKTINTNCETAGKVMPVLIEINSGRETSKTGVLPERLDDLLSDLAGMEYIHIQGLMTMGPRFGDPEDARPYFQATRKAFERLAKLPNLDMRYLSMGMSNSYLIAIEEGANVIRIGTKIFGERPTSA
jgi:pyridoxal phosphate enzyme (YggS family)